MTWAITAPGFKWREVLLGMLAFGLVAGWAPAVWAEDGADRPPEAQQLLLEMIEAERSVDFHGDFMFAQGDSLELMHITHLVDGDRRLQRVAAMSGPPREIFRDGDRVVCFYPEERRAVVMRGGEPHGFLGLSREDVDGLDALYEFQARDGGRIAGRKAWHLEIEAADGIRFGYRLWLDKKTGLLLRSELIHPDGELRQRMIFTSLQQVANGELEHWLPDERDDGPFTWIHQDYQAEPDPENTVHWKPEWLPEGFELKVERSRGASPDQMLMQHLVYGDGLNTISVFVEPEQVVDLPEGAVTVGAADAYSLRVEKRRVTVLGEVTAETLERVARSMPGIEQ